MHKVFYFGIIAILLISLKYTHLKTEAAGDCSNDCVTKDIGTLDSLNNFTSDNDRVLEQNSEYWVKLTIKGRDTQLSQPNPSASSVTTSYGGSDIMIVLDTTGSMGDSMRKYNTGNETTQRYLAARNALTQFISSSDSNAGDGTVDYIGLGSFKYCERYFASTGIPISWVYGGYNVQFNKNIGFGAIHYPLQALTDTNKDRMITTVNQMFRLDGGPAFCTENLPGDETNTGAGITVGSTQLSPLLNHPNAAPYKASAQGHPGTNNGPLAREYTQNRPIPKYVILATDGEENQPPLSYDEEIDKQGKTIVRTAADYGIKIYTVAIDGEGEDPLLQRIANDTGGKFFTGRTEQALIQSFTAIRNDITSDASTVITGTSSVIQERINTAYFRIPPLNDQSFKMIRNNNTTINCGSNLAQCVRNANSNELEILVPEITSQEQVTVYFKVLPINTSGSGNIPVDNPSSNINYPSLSYREPVNNVSVRIIPPTAQAFFEIQNAGDIYSKGGIDITLPNENKLLLTSLGHGIVKHHTSQISLTPSRSQLSTKGWELANYEITSQLENKYTYANILKGRRAPVGINMNTTRPTESGTYIHSGNLSLNPGSFTSLDGKQYLIFVDGNLYINGDIALYDKGYSSRSSLTFIVSGNIGIHPNVNDATNRQVHGVFVTDGIIDTVCNSSFTGSSCAPSKPSYHDSSLTLQGVFIAQEGFNLERRGNPNALIPGEKFIYRPEAVINATTQLGVIRNSWRELSE